MSRALDILRALHFRGISLRRDGDKLKFTAVPGAMTEELLSAVKDHKAALLELLSKPLAPGWDFKVIKFPDGSAGVENPVSLRRLSFWGARELGWPSVCGIEGKEAAWFEFAKSAPRDRIVEALSELADLELSRNRVQDVRKEVAA